MKASACFLSIVPAAAVLFLAAGALAGDTELPMERAEMLSAFGERAAFSPDGKRIAFIGKSYGDAFEIELSTGEVRKLTAHVPHQGILRVQYLEDGDYLLTGPKWYAGDISHIDVDLFVLDSDLKHGLQPLDQGVFEGVAVGPGDIIAWQQIPVGTELVPDESWLQAARRVQLEHYLGRIEYRDGRPLLVDKRRILHPDPTGCGFNEVQDFRQDGNEIVFCCGGKDAGVAAFLGIIGHDLRTGTYTVYHKALGREYAEVEGLSPDGSWAAVECGTREGDELVPVISICRLELQPDGKFSRLIVGTAPGSTRKISNPVISQDGEWIAFQGADTTLGNIGPGSGIYLMHLPD